MTEDPQQTLRTAYLALLRNQVFTAGPVYAQVYADFIPSNATRPYVFLSQQTVAERNTGSCPSAECTILVEVVQAYQGNLAKTSEVNDMAKQVIKALAPLKTFPGNELEGFKVTSHVLELSTPLTEQENDFIVFRRLLRFRDIVFETVTT
ncbi:hypothetical protein [Rufibacter soli]